jgi:two-component system chemotaxis response regulator CheY
VGSRPVQQWISLIRAEITGMLNGSRYVLDNINVFIIDDNRHMRGLVKSILHALGVKEIGEAGDAADAFTELQHFTADIIIVDWYMEPLDGLDFVRLMRTAKDSPNPYIPIIMLTGYTEYRRVAEARDAGINEFLAKPISPRDLYLRIASIIDHPRPFVRARGYFGPDRRRYNVGVPRGLRERRKKELEKADEMVG